MGDASRRFFSGVAAFAATVAFCGAEPQAAVGQGHTIALPHIPFPSLEPEHLFAAPTKPDRIGRVLAPVTINGQGPFRMIVDTGANQSVLTTRLARTLGLVVDSHVPVKLSGVTGSIMVPTASVDRFETGDLRQQGLRLPVMNSVMGGAEGVLGMDGFDGMRVSVDFVNDEIRIARSRGQRPSSRFVRIPVNVHFNKLLLATGRVGNIKVKAVIDTGAERTLGNVALRKELEKRRYAGATPIYTGVIGLSDVMQHGEAIFTRSLRLGDLTVTDLYVIYGDIDVFRLWNLQNEPAMLIGMDVLGTLHTLVIDYRLEEVQVRLRDERFERVRER